MAIVGNRRGKFSTKRKIALAVGILFSGVALGGIALVTNQPDVGSKYSLDELRQQVLSMRPQIFETVKDEESPPEEFRTSLKKRYYSTPKAFPYGNVLGGPLPLPSLTPGALPGPIPGDNLSLVPVSGPGFTGENLSIHTTLTGDFGVKGLSETNGQAARVPLTKIPSVLGGGNPRDGIESIVDDIFGGGRAQPGDLLKRSADTSLLLSGAGDGFPDSQSLEIAKNSIPSDLKQPADLGKAPSASDVPAPAPLLLIGVGLVGLGIMRRSKAHKGK